MIRILMLLGVLAMTPHAVAIAGAPPGESVRRPHVSARLVADATPIRPGVPFELGVLFEIDEDWHIYGSDPGSTGLPTRIRLGAPAGWEIGAIKWPEPKRYDDGLGGVSLGYEGRVLLAATITPPAHAASAKSVWLSADVSWLVCHHNCIRGRALLRVERPVAATSAELPAVPEDGAAGLAKDAGTSDACAGVVAEAGVAGGGGGSTPASFALALLFALLGGLLLNAMPCVLPVLSLKVMSLVAHAGHDRRTMWWHGLAYTAGVLTTFVVLSAILLALQAGSWAFQMQSPTFVAIFVAILFGFALSLFGVFEVRLPGSNALDARVAGADGLGRSFLYGAFAVLLGTPCTAPFLGPAMTYALAQPPAQMMVLMLTVGLGLALPFLLLARFPGWRRILPAPGPWLVTFKKVMAFLLVGAALFFLQTLSAQLSRAAFMSYLAFLAVVAVSAWVYGHWGASARGRWSRRLGAAGAAALLVIGAAGLVSDEPRLSTATPELAAGIAWQNFIDVDVEAEALAGRTVFIDFTAQWCATCKVNEANAIHTERVREVFDALEVLPVKADFTRFEPRIAQWLTRFDEPSVPLYVVLPAGRPEAAIKLPTFPLTASDVLSAVCSARG